MIEHSAHHIMYRMGGGIFTDDVMPTLHMLAWYVSRVRKYLLIDQWTGYVVFHGVQELLQRE